MSLTCSEQDDLVIQGQLGEVGDPLGPLHQGEELFVCCLADVCHRVVGLPKKKKKNMEKLGKGRVRIREAAGAACLPPLRWMLSLTGRGSDLAAPPQGL